MTDTATAPTPTGVTTVTTPAPAKPGYLSTEFWLALAVKLLGGAYAAGLISDGTTTADRIAGLAVVVLAYFGYTVSRTIVKSTTAANGNATTAFGPIAAPTPAPSSSSTTTIGSAASLLLVLGLVGAGAALTGCTGAQRQDTLKSALVTVDSARDGFLAYDRVHEHDIVANATTLDDANSKLVAYRTKRADVDKLFAGTYHALAAAAIANDDPSLKSAQALLAQLIAAVTPFLGGN